MGSLIIYCSLVAIIFLASKGNHWKCLHKSIFGSPTTIRNYIRKWSKAGFFDKMRSHDLLNVEMGEVLCDIARLEKEIRRKEDARDWEWAMASAYYYDEAETIMQELRNELIQDDEKDLIMGQIAYEDEINSFVDELFQDKEESKRMGILSQKFTEVFY